MNMKDVKEITGVMNYPQMREIQILKQLVKEQSKDLLQLAMTCFSYGKIVAREEFQLEESENPDVQASQKVFAVQENLERLSILGDRNRLLGNKIMQFFENGKGLSDRERNELDLLFDHLLYLQNDNYEELCKAEESLEALKKLPTSSQVNSKTTNK